MVNVLGLNRAAVIGALEREAGCRFEELKEYKPLVPAPGFWCGVINGKFVILDMRADDGFDEADFDLAVGPGAAQRAIDRLRADF